LQFDDGGCAAMAEQACMDAAAICH